jgi:DNA-binding MarR family transcriptional regulator
MKSPKQIPKPSSLETHVGFWLRFVSNNVSARFESQVYEREGCSVSEWVALRTLYERSGTSHAELIHALGMTKGATSKIVSRLEERELVKRELAEGSSREQLIALTPAGKELVPRLAAIADENDAYFFGHLDALEQKSLVDTLKALVEQHKLQGPPVN